MVLVETRALVKQFGAFTAVDDISFSVNRGEVVGFLGPNGAGKSTTMKIVAGFLEPTSGQAFIAGHDSREDPIAARQRLGYLPEGAPAYPDMTVGAFLEFVAAMRGLSPARANERLAELAERIDLEEVWNRRIEALSKGFKRRVVMMNGNIQWRPNPPFKNNAGSHVDKRLFGELVIDDIPTSLNKAEADNRIAGPLANALIEHLHDVDPNGVLSQARNFYIDTYKVQLKERAGGNSPGTPNDPQDEPVEGKTAATGVSNSSSVLTSAIDDGKKFLAGSFLMPDDMKRVPLFVTRDNVPATWGQGSLSLTVSVPALVHRNLKINSADELCLIVLRYIVAIEVAKVSNAIAELEVLLPKISIFPSQS